MRRVSWYLVLGLVLLTTRSCNARVVFAAPTEENETKLGENIDNPHLGFLDDETKEKIKEAFWKKLFNMVEEEESALGAKFEEDVQVEKENSLGNKGNQEEKSENESGFWSVLEYDPEKELEQAPRNELDAEEENKNFWRDYYEENNVKYGEEEFYDEIEKQINDSKKGSNENDIVENEDIFWRVLSDEEIDDDKKTALMREFLSWKEAKGQDKQTDGNDDESDENKNLDDKKPKDSEENSVEEVPSSDTEDSIWKWRRWLIW